MKLYDMHTHSSFSHDSVCSIQDMAEAQMRQGVSAFAVTEHCDCLSYRDSNAADMLQASYNEARRLHTQLGGKIEILCGVEIGEGFLVPEAQACALSLCDYDVVIGSVHYVHDPKGISGYCADTDFSPLTEQELTRFIDSYLSNMLSMLKNTPCDILAHLTYPLRYINGKYGRSMDFRPFSDKIRDILRYIIEHGIALELNTSGLGTPYNACFPDEWVLALYRDLGGQLMTLGSDAHAAPRAAFGFLQAVALMRKAGFSEYHYYKKRLPFSCKL